MSRTASFFESNLAKSAIPMLCFMTALHFEEKEGNKVYIGDKRAENISGWL